MLGRSFLNAVRKPASPFSKYFSSSSDIYAELLGGSSSAKVVPQAIVRVRKVDEFGRSYGTGRRKTSVARVWLKDGSGQFIVNHKPLTEYFQPMQRADLLAAFLISQTAGLFDVYCTVKGGGISGQAGAVRLGISRALQEFDPLYRPILKSGLTYEVWLLS